MDGPDDFERRIIILLSKVTGVPPDKLDRTSRLLRDCGLDGDDAAEFLKAYSAEFHVDLANFDFAKHFGSEAGFDPVTWAIRGLFSKGRKTLTPITVTDLVLSARLGKWQQVES
jgi:hypothetical protein